MHTPSKRSKRDAPAGPSSSDRGRRACRLLVAAGIGISTVALMLLPATAAACVEGRDCRPTPVQPAPTQKHDSTPNRVQTPVFTPPQLPTITMQQQPPQLPPPDLPPPVQQAPPPPVQWVPPPQLLPQPPVVVPLPPPPPIELPLPPPPPPVVEVPAVLELSQLVIGPGGEVTATGRGCLPDAPVSLSIRNVQIGQTVASASGGFETPLATGSVGVGRHEVTAVCGPTLNAALDVVLASHVGTDTSTLTLIMIFLLLGVWFYSRLLTSHRQAWGI